MRLNKYLLISLLYSGFFSNGCYAMWCGCCDDEDTNARKPLVIQEGNISSQADRNIASYQQHYNDANGGTSQRPSEPYAPNPSKSSKKNNSPTQKKTEELESLTKDTEETKESLIVFKTISKEVMQLLSNGKYTKELADDKSAVTFYLQPGVDLLYCFRNIDREKQIGKPQQKYMVELHKDLVEGNASAKIASWQILKKCIEEVNSIIKDCISDEGERLLVTSLVEKLIECTECISQGESCPIVIKKSSRSSYVKILFMATAEEGAFIYVKKQASK